jgi:hypothetical protein
MFLKGSYQFFAVSANSASLLDYFHLLFFTPLVSSYEEGQKRPALLPPLQPGRGQEQHPGRDTGLAALWIRIRIGFNGVPGSGSRRATMTPQN